MPKISFQKERDFSALFSDTLSFLKQNFKSFFGSILLIAGPFLLISGAALGYLQSGSLYMRGYSPYGGFGGKVDVGMIITIVSIVAFSTLVGSMVLYCTVFNYMLLYNEKPEGERVTVSEVGRKVLESIWRTLGSFLILILVFGLLVAIIALAAVGIGYGLGLVGTVLVGFGAIVAIIIFGPPLGYVFQAMFFVVIRDRIIGMSAFAKVWNYMKGNFWWTWVAIVTASTTLYVINLIFTLPATIYALVGTFSRMQTNDLGEGTSNASVTLIILYTISMFFSYFTASIMQVLCAFNFLSHEEAKEGKGLFSKIDEIK